MSNYDDEKMGFHRPTSVTDQSHYDHSAGGLGTAPTWLAPNKIASSDFNTAYTDYSSSLTWTSTGTAPVLGNAVVTARYKKVGKFVHFYGNVTFGNTTTFGTLLYRFSLPVAAAAAANTAQIAGLAYLYDSSAGAFGSAVVVFPSTTTICFEYGGTYLGTLAQAAQLQPWTWATSDQIAWNIMYEAT